MDDPQFSWDELQWAGKKLYGEAWIGKLTPHEESILRTQTRCEQVPTSQPGRVTTYFYYGEWDNEALRERRKAIAVKETEMIAQWSGAKEWLQANQLSLWPLPGPEPDGEKDVGGRPEKFDKVQFYVEIIRLANSPDGLPDRQALSHYMGEWCIETFGKEPKKMRDLIQPFAHLCRPK
jgi:hypothetical protein